ncbi:ATP dependent DNA ligase [Coprinopsis sp. MPI-PUGE-AT-0042]|nr:ATP dependent DNA ligase [Coprinopsis sp. MPI-PUGE-AT-0042]
MADIALAKCRGCLALVGGTINKIAQDALEIALTHDADLSLPSFQPNRSMAYHITFLTKDELRCIPNNKVIDLAPDTRHVHAAGIGGNPQAGVFYVVVIWAAGQQLRKQLGLPPKHFHITLSDKDEHEMDKGVKSLLPELPPLSPSLDLFDHLCFTLHSMGQYAEAQSYAIQMVCAFGENHKGFLRLADAALAGGYYKLSMLSYAAAYERTQDPKLSGYCLKKMATCSENTEWGCVFMEDEVSTIPEDLGPVLIVPWSNTLCFALGEANVLPTRCLQARHPLYIPKSKTLPRGALDLSLFYRLPRWFRWLIPFRFAIMSTPRREEDIMALASSYLGIRRVLTLTEEEPLRREWFEGRTISNTFMPVTNFHPPSIEQMDLVMRMFMEDDNLPLLVHCGGGKGRAGTVAASYIVASGFKCPPSYEQNQPEYSAADAIATLRSLRPGSLETERQEKFVSEWASAIWKRQCIFPEVPSEAPPCPLAVEGSLQDLKDGDLFLLVGLPGSGKTWVSKSLLARDPKRWQHISQDESGSRALLETEIGRVAKGKRVLLDRCNMAVEDRKSWLSLASNWVTNPVCVWFDYDKELCLSRAQRRVGHPTLKPGNRVRNAVAGMEKMFARPTTSEGFKAVAIIRSFQAAQELVRHLSPSVGIFKFPRTPHLINLGAATDDDEHVQLAIDTTKGNTRVVVTEKVDGANMGFSLSADKQILVQNRSHYVNPTSHDQFKKLGAWVDKHRQELLKLLDRDPYFPERYILFGEWLYATHSIAYSRLPDYFMAFDLYDRQTGAFISTKALRGLLADTSISVVPLLHEGVLPGESELKEMVQRKSTYYEGRVEGVYLKVETDLAVVHRAKIVRSDFIAGNEHWTKAALQVNAIDAHDLVPITP